MSDAPSSRSAFVVDGVAETLFDPVRNLRLVRDDTPTGSSGYLSFKLVGGDFDWQFFAKLTSQSRIDGLDVDPNDDTRLVWKIYSGGVLDDPEHAEVRALIRDAMLTFKSWFGAAQPEWTYSVMFEPRGEADQ